jgi:hypothetical protein
VTIEADELTIRERREAFEAADLSCAAEAGVPTKGRLQRLGMPAGVCSIPNMAPTNGPRRIASSVVEIDSDARDLRESLRELSGLWRTLEPSTAQRIRFLLSEVVSRLADPRRRPRGKIRVLLDVHATFVRLEISSNALTTAHGDTTTDELSFPVWIIEDLAERWGNGPDEGEIWFEIDRSETER